MCAVAVQIINVLGLLWKDLRRHFKGYIVLLVVEAILIKYLQALRDVISDSLVDIGLNGGKIIVYPLLPEVFPWPHIVYTSGNLPIDPLFVTDDLKYRILLIGKTPAALALIIATPIIIYGAFRILKHVTRKKEPTCVLQNQECLLRRPEEY